MEKLFILTMDDCPVRPTQLNGTKEELLKQFSDLLDTLEYDDVMNLELYREK